MASIEITEKGFYTTIQDSGRLGYGALGIPESGAMDQDALNLSNLLLNNPKNAAALECTLVGPTITFLKDIAFVLTGAISDVTLDGQAIQRNQVLIGKKSSVLKVGKVLQGCRVYVGLDGGIETQEVLGSKSLFFPVTPQGSLSMGMQIPTGRPKYGDTKGVHLSTKNTSLNQQQIKVSKGPEYDFLSSKGLRNLMEKSYTITSWNRMGIALDALIQPHELKTSTGPVLPGTVQLTPSGRLYVLMRDCQTTGGYPRILQLTKEAINILSQKKTADRIGLVI